MDQNSTAASEKGNELNNSFLERTITELRNNNEQLEKSLAFLTGNLLPRLDHMANRLNSGEYPKNMEKSTDNKGVQDGSIKPAPIQMSIGLVGDLVGAVNNGAQLRRKLEVDIYPEIEVALSFLEKHI